MGRNTCSPLICRLLCVTTLAISHNTGVFAQGEERPGDLVYLFALDGITTHAGAKPVQYALTQLDHIHMCHFVEEESSFKLASPMKYDLAGLRRLVASTGHALKGPVVVSNGRILSDRDTTSPNR